MAEELTKSPKTYFNIHNHTHFSNNRFLDSMNSVVNLIKQAKNKGMAGIGITDHGVLSGHIKVAKMMDSNPNLFTGKGDNNHPFKVVLGEEIYLDDFPIIKNAVDNNKKTKFFHFVLTAKDDIGYHALRIITSNSWGVPLEHINYDSKSPNDGSPKPGTEDSQKMKNYRARQKYHGFFFRGMRRLPTYKDWLYKLMNDPHYNFKGHVIASTACLGSELSQSIVNGDKSRAKKFIKYIEKTFGKQQCYFEMMPAHRASQDKVNKALWNISHGQGYFSDNTGKGIPCIISTDSHYIDNRDQQAHSVFLKSENPNRDVIDFYKYAHLFTYNELKNYFPHTPQDDVLDEACQNSLNLLARYAPIWHLTNEKQMAKITKEHPDNKPIRLHYRQEIPESPIPKVIPPINLKKYTQKYNIDWSKYPWFEKFNKSPLKEDRYYLLKIFHGIKARNVPMNNTYLSQINWELNTLHILTEYFHEPMSAYFLTVFYAVIDTCWNADSIVGPGRGSAGEWVTNYLLGITQVNSIKWHLWAPRFSCKDRRDDMPDIDLDSESSRRLNIIALLKKKYGQDRVLNFSTFGTQAAKSTIYTCCRGLHINYIQAQNIANLLPADSRGMGNISLHDALFGNKKKQIKPAKSFIKAVKAHPGLEQALLGVGGKIRGVSEHASGVALWNEPLTQRNAMMRTNRAPGIPITQFSAHDSAYLSSLKYDILTLSALDRLHEALRLLLRNKKIKPFYHKNGKFDLYKTYMHYFGPQALDFTSKGMYEMLFDGEVTNAFEFSSIVGRNALLTMHATDFSALVAANALMRLTVDPNSKTYESKMMRKYWGTKEQPINRYVRYRDNKGAWDKDMNKFGLTPNEIKVMHKYLQRHRGVCYSQEDLMKISMDPAVAHFPYIKANKLRKAVAKKDPKILESTRQDFYKSGLKQNAGDDGTEKQRKNFLDYVWYNCAVPAKNYSFNLAHGVAYTIILIIEMNICYRFGPIYWQTACLSVNAGMYGDEFKNPDYGKLDKALAGLKGKVANPNINRSDLGFVPYHNKILYGLYPIAGLSADDAKTIINERKKNGKYKSFDDFLKRTDFTKKTNITLIKSGAFDELAGGFNHRMHLMWHYLNTQIKNKKRLTMTQIPKIRQFIPDKYNKYVKIYDFRSQITGRKKQQLTPELKKSYSAYMKIMKDSLRKQGKLSKKDKDSSSKQTTLFSTPLADKNGYLAKDKVKPFNRMYNKYVKPMKDWLKGSDAIADEKRTRIMKLWNKYCQGNAYSWEMDALGCYVKEHELLKTNIADKYGVITDYTKVPKTPQVAFSWTYKYGRNKGKQGHIFKHYLIYGTVINKNANKGLVYLLTPNGVANVYCGKWRYSIYNKKVSKKTAKRKNISPKGSWFDRGTKLAVVGYRQGSNFFVNRSGLAKKKYSECLFRIAGYGKKAHLVTILNKNGKKNLTPKTADESEADVRKRKYNSDCKHIVSKCKKLRVIWRTKEQHSAQIKAQMKAYHKGN